jgi:SAM-dependent methyltransferase
VPGGVLDAGGPNRLGHLLRLARSLGEPVGDRHEIARNRSSSQQVNTMDAPDQDTIAMWFFEMFNGLPRQGPGDAASTLKALALVPGVGPETHVLDVGCGTGLQTRVLAQNSSAHFVAIDNHPPFVEELKRQASDLGIADRIDARVGDMRRLDFPNGSFDLIWCEGAIYVMGFAAALREWRRLLVPGGHMAVSQVCWTRPDPPPECAAFWAQEYPEIRTVSALLAVIEECGHQVVGHFPLPSAAWWDDYYSPLERNVARFRQRHEEPGAQQLAEQTEREIDVWKEYSEFYGYHFFVMRAL